MYTEVELLEWAERIAEHCEETHFCEGCPFKVETIDCALKTQTPEHWIKRLYEPRLKYGAY